jgi:16S rRNA (adenine1518-N6/adenine1519-N6)-dimethyltransferase
VTAEHDPLADPLASAAGGRRPPWSAFRAALEEEGFRPTKSLGQNFLVDANAARAIARDSGLAAGDWVLEVGAGCGLLSVHLLELGVELGMVEIDPRLARVAGRFLSGRTGWRLRVSDALAGKNALAPALLATIPEREWHLVSNLPYSIAGPLLVLLSRLGNPPRTMTVLVQEEVARRIAARAGDPDWGALSARLAALYEAHMGRPVGAQLFWPRPRVESRVVRLERARSGLPSAAELVDYDRLVDGLFQRRRKQVGTALATLVRGREEALEMTLEAGVDPRLRPQDLGVPELFRLARTRSWRRGSGGGAPGTQV